jgi:hypothetical protein
MFRPSSRPSSGLGYQPHGCITGVLKTRYKISCWFTKFSIVILRNRRLEGNKNGGIREQVTLLVKKECKITQNYKVIKSLIDRLKVEMFS